MSDIVFRWLFCLLLVLSVGRLAPDAVAKDTRPNFLFIITDDQNADSLRAYNPQSTLETPVVDRLAREGMVFEVACYMGGFVAGVCVPSRHMIMTGRSLWHLPETLTSRYYENYPAGKCPPDILDHTLPAVFNRAGYSTMKTGKRGTSYAEANALFTVQKDESKVGDTDETGSAWHAEQVLSYLDQREKEGDEAPFLIFFGFSHPHDPRDEKAELLQKYGAVNYKDPEKSLSVNPKAPPLPINYLPSHPFDLGEPGLRDEVRVEGVWESREEAVIRNETGRYYACCDNIDTQIGRVWQRLEAMGEAENIYIFFTSDNGISLGRHGIQGKQHLYDHAWRVPFIVQGPGIQPGARVRGNIYLMDVLATLCDLAGIEAPSSNEGTSFRPVLEGKQDSVRDVLYAAYCGGTKPGIRAVRKGDWKLVLFDVLDGSVRQKQLFNLAENPHELLNEHHDPKIVKLTGNTPSPTQRNLADDPRYAEKLREMEDLLLQEMRQHDDPYRLWTQPSDSLTPLIDVMKNQNPKKSR